MERTRAPLGAVWGLGGDGVLETPAATVFLLGGPEAKGNAVLHRSVRGHQEEDHVVEVHEDMPLAPF